MQTMLSSFTIEDSSHPVLEIDSAANSDGHEHIQDDQTNISDNRLDVKVIHDARRKWALIHFYALRPAFSVSLLLYIASLTSTRGTLTFASGVIDPIRGLAGLIKLESGAYTSCVHQSMIRSMNELESLAKDDQTRVEAMFDSNRKTVERAEISMFECVEGTKKARASLNQWRADGMEIPWMDVSEIDSRDGNMVDKSSNENIMCTRDKRNQTEHVLGRDFSISENQVHTILNNYVTHSQSSLAAITEYAAKRFKYDRNYFILQRIQPALDYLSRQSLTIQTAGIEMDINATEVGAMIQNQIRILQEELEEAKQQIEKLEQKLAEFRISISAFYNNYNELYDRLSKAAETVYGFLPPGSPLPAIFDFSDLQVADFFLPPTGLTWPEFDLEYRNVQAKIEQVVQGCLNILIQTLKGSQIEAMQSLREAVQTLSQGLAEILELEDYNPPTFQGSREDIFDMNQELDIHHTLGSEALNRTAQAVKELTFQLPSFRNISAPEILTPEIDVFDYNFADETSTTFELLNVMIPKLLLFQHVLNTIAFLGAYAFLLDIICGCFQWWRLSSIYEEGALPNMPEIRSDNDHHQGKEERPQRNYKIIIFILKSFLNPFFVGFLIFFSSIAFVLVTFWIPHVEEMCVDSSRGTWFANNMLSPVLTNLAMAEGNAQYLVAEHSCVATQNELCTRIGFEVENRVKSDVTALRSFQAQRNRSVEALLLLTDCIDLHRMAEMVNEACCGLKGFKTIDCTKSPYVCPIDSSTTPPSAFRPLTTYVESNSCFESMYELNLEQETYDCTSLKEGCYHIPCDGVNDELIRKYTLEADCRVETWILNTCRFWCAVIVHFLMLYGICSLMYFGCRDLCWREIIPDSIPFRTLLREDGKLKRGHNIQEMSGSISSEIQWFERKAKLQLLMGISMLWMYFIVTVTLIVRS